MTRRARHHLIVLLRRFGRRDRGAAVVEFALILPVLLLLFVGSIEASTLITVDRRLNVISGTVGDLVARWDPAEAATIPTNTLLDYFKAAEGIIIPYPTAGLEQVVSIIKVDSDGTTKVKWSCGYNGGAARTTDSAYTALPPKMNELARGPGWVVASETAYSYTPVIGIVFQDALGLTSESFYLPRFEKEIKFGACPA